MNPYLGKIFILIGLTLVIFGVILLSPIQIPWLGRLPGDIWVKKENFSFYFPLTSSILLSILLSLVFYLFRR